MSDVTMTAGETLRLDVTVTNPDGTVRDITDATLNFEVYDSPSKHTLVLLGEASVVEGAEGTAVASLGFTDTFDLPFSVLYYVIFLYEQSGEHYVVQDGKLLVNAGYVAP